MDAQHRTWVGMFDQPNFGEYPVMLSMRDNIRVDYPSLPCGGHLTVEKIEDGVAYLRECITYGNQTCLDGVQVQLSKQRDRLRFVVPPGRFARWRSAALARPAAPARGLTPFPGQCEGPSNRTAPHA